MKCSEKAADDFEIVNSVGSHKIFELYDLNTIYL